MSLVAVADQYLAQVRQMAPNRTGCPLRVPGDRRPAATLKSRSLAAGHRAAAVGRRGGGVGRRRSRAPAGSVSWVQAARRSAWAARQPRPARASAAARARGAGPGATALQAIAPALLASLYEAVERRRRRARRAESDKARPHQRGGAPLHAPPAASRRLVTSTGRRSAAPRLTRSWRRCWPSWSCRRGRSPHVVQATLFGPITSSARSDRRQEARDQ